MNESIQNDEQFQQRLKEHEAYRKLPSKSVRFPYYCGTCHAQHWLSYLDIMAQVDAHIFPCGHDWNKTYYKPAVWEEHKLHNLLPEVSI